MKTISFQAKEHSTAQEAVFELNYSGDRAISIGGRFFTLNEAEYRWIEEMGIQPTTWHHHEATGRIISVPGKQ